MDEWLGDFFYDHPLICIAIILIPVFYGFYRLNKAEQRNYKIFMTACMVDHKEYECYAMWKGTKPSTVVVPAPIIVR